MSKSAEKVLTKGGVDDIPLGFIGFCQICGSKDLQQVLNMGFFAPCDSLLTKEQLRKPERSYPLNLTRCRDCGLVQIDHAVDPAELFFPEYPYRSGITETLRNNLHGISSRMVEKLGLKKGSLVVDIGSNDGTILEGFKACGMRVLGVEPTNIADIANGKGIETLKQFFTREAGRALASRHGNAQLVTAANVFAHVRDLPGLMGGVSNLLEDDGFFVTESHYQLDILETLQYDSVYHEHLRFYLMKPLVRLFDIHGFTLVDVERIPNYGGSIRVYARKGRGHAVAKSVRELTSMEEERGAYADAEYEKFAKRTQASRSEIRSLVVRLNGEGKRVVGVGCPGRSATLLTYCGLSPDLIPYIAEQSTSLKLGLYTPGTHIPVVDEARMFEEQPEFALVLSWHYAKPIIKTLRSKGLRSKMIVPLPSVQILE